LTECYRPQEHADMAEILHYSAFDVDGHGGNPAGVVLDAGLLDDAAMLRIAAELGYSETAYLHGDRIRYFSPRAEVGFCGHATIATAVALAERDGVGARTFRSNVGDIRVRTGVRDGRVAATLTSAVPHVREVDDADLVETLAALRWREGDLDPSLPPRIANAGNDHLVIAAGTRSRLAALDYDFARLEALMLARGWTTLQLVWAQDPETFHARNPFPPGGVVEDPATGAAAAALGGYLRELHLLVPPAQFSVSQGVDMGRPSRLVVDVPASGGIEVSGTAVVVAPAGEPHGSPSGSAKSSSS
jgi:PhzF family phenazine biosynthesis protein